MIGSMWTRGSNAWGNSLFCRISASPFVTCVLWCPNVSLQSVLNVSRVHLHFHVVMHCLQTHFKAGVLNVKCYILVVYSFIFFVSSYTAYLSQCRFTWFSSEVTDYWYNMHFTIINQTLHAACWCDCSCVWWPILSSMHQSHIQLIPWKLVQIEIYGRAAFHN